MDTVEGVKGCKVFLTLLFRQSKFMLIYLMEEKTMECVEKAFDNIKKIIGIEVFKKVFEVVLTDNGSDPKYNLCKLNKNYLQNIHTRYII